MIMFDRKEGELPPLLYAVGNKIMGYHVSLGIQSLVGGEIVEAVQSTSYLDENSYKVKLEPELCGKDKEIGKETTLWINEKEAKPFNQDVWNKAVGHWIEHNIFKEKSYLSYVRMHRALRGENDNIGDEELLSDIDKRHGLKDKDNKE